MATANEEFRDALIRHQIFLMRLAGSIRNDMFQILNDTEPRLRKLVEDRLDTLARSAGVDLTRPGAQRRVAALERAVRELRAPAFDEVFNLWNRDLRDMMQNEVQFMQQALRTTMPVVLDPRLPENARMNALLREDPFRGKTLRNWMQDVRDADLERIRGEIRIGLVEGDTNRGIARRIVGEARLRGANGVTEITRRQAAAITRTAVTHFSNAAKQEFYLANEDILNVEVYTATLDSRTTPICRSLDGRQFPIGEGPYPPLHINCRSTRIAVVDAEAIGERPFKASTERQLVDEFAARNPNIGRRAGSVSQRADLPRGFKGAFDQFARRRVREMTGQVPATLNYQQWLRGQSREFQNDVLGVAKARLFRRGGLTLDRFVNRRGDELTLRELAIRDRQAFVQAGLDPDEFLQAA